MNSLYAVYEKADKGFADRYLDMLAAGGTKHHKELLAPFGLDASDPQFWSMGLKVVEGLIDELEAMDAVLAAALERTRRGVLYVYVFRAGVVGHRADRDQSRSATPRPIIFVRGRGAAALRFDLPARVQSLASSH